MLAWIPAHNPSSSRMSMIAMPTPAALAARRRGSARRLRRARGTRRCMTTFSVAGMATSSDALTLHLRYPIGVGTFVPTGGRSRGARSRCQGGHLMKNLHYGHCLVGVAVAVVVLVA